MDGHAEQSRAGDLAPENPLKNPAAGPGTRDWLLHAIEHARHYLPSQGPIENFIHHNTLHAFQHLEFHEALSQAALLHGAEVYLPEAEYRRGFRDGSVEPADLAVEIRQCWRGRQDQPLADTTVFAVEEALVRYGVPDETPASVAWAMQEQAIHTQVRGDLPADLRQGLIDKTQRWLEGLSASQWQDQGPSLVALGDLPSVRLRFTQAREHWSALLLWTAVSARWSMRELSHEPQIDREVVSRLGRDRTWRDVLVAAGGIDPAQWVSPILMRLAGAYIDRDVARWPLPHRDGDLMAAFLHLMEVAPQMQHGWQARAVATLQQARLAGVSALDVIAQELELAGVAAKHAEHYLARVMLVLPGWFGMVSRLETTCARMGARLPHDALRELVAIRLVLDRYAAQEAAKQSGLGDDLGQLATRVARQATLRQRRSDRVPAFEVFALAQAAGLAVGQIQGLPRNAVGLIDGIFARWDRKARQKVLHLATERRHRSKILDALACQWPHRENLDRHGPRAHFVFCIDDREEGIRRHLEELDTSITTASVAGFFGVAMNFRPLDDPEPRAQCPAIVEPAHAVLESASASHAGTAQVWSRRRTIVAALRKELVDGSTSFLRGGVIAPVLGLFRLIPMMARVLAPRQSVALQRRINSALVPRPRTQLQVARTDDSEKHGALPVGFTLNERTDRVAATLENIGLVRDFPALIVILGHQATTSNNPHHGAYECGACGGRSGGPNARVFAMFANDPQVREMLARRGITIPSSTWFVGGVHDTTLDEITLFDTHKVPPSHAAAYRDASNLLDRARQLSAQERCRKFETAAPTIEALAALHHVQVRAADISQARPELGHATNAVCIVGRRSLTKQLFFDRRSFLVSYDYGIDPDGNILARILAPVIPVCAGINLEYYFSSVDNEYWGCGTKLPHNLSCLVGVMEGASGDLRTGLPRQMVEVHQPIRQMTVIEAPSAVLAKVLERPGEAAELVRGGWVRVATIDPHTGAIETYENGTFQPYQPENPELPIRSRSRDWYRGHMGFLNPARIVSQAI